MRNVVSLFYSFDNLCTKQTTICLFCSVGPDAILTTDSKDMTIILLLALNFVIRRLRIRLSFRSVSANEAGELLWECKENFILIVCQIKIYALLGFPN